VLFPFEGRNWEKHLVAAARAAGVAHVVGYQHSSVTPRHLAFAAAGDAAAGWPDWVITVGEVTAGWLKERAPDLAERIVVGASLRRGTARLAAPAKPGLLVAISSSREEALALMQLVHAAATRLRLPVRLRSHPTIKAEDLFARFSWPANVRLSTTSPLEEDLAASSIVGYASSTVVLEGMLQGRLPLFLDIGDVPSGDPLLGECTAKAEARDADGFVAAVDGILNLDEVRLAQRQAAALRYAEAYLPAPDESRIRAIVAAATEPVNRPAATLRLSAVIPTRNRPAELETAVASILAQERLPQELVIVDQSLSEDGRRRTEALVAARGKDVLLRYVHDSAIAGLVHAKQAAVSVAQGDIVCFLEDDEVLEPGYLAAIERGFQACPHMLGCCGVVTNLPEFPAGYRFFFHLFHRGMFRDPRVGVHGRAGADAGLIPSACLSGGLSCWRREVLAQVPFDTANGFHLLEDIDYSSRAAERFGERFYLNPAARLEHRMSPVNRELHGERQRRKLREYLVFWKKRTHQPGAAWSLAWLLCGLFAEALWQSIRALSPAPAIGFFRGIADGARWRLRGDAR
jgi:GT2 family glycosyltransferase